MNEEKIVEKTVSEETISEETNSEETISEETNSEKKERFLNEKRLEILVAVTLGITAILVAWATWIGSLHGGNQATNYALSNNLAAEGNAEYNVAAQLFVSDLMAWNTMMDYQFEKQVALMEGNEEEAELIQSKAEKLIVDNCSERMMNAILQAADETSGDDITASPFTQEGFIEGYFEESNALLAESQALLEQGREDNANGDKYGLVTVIFSVVLFLLGIVGIFKQLPNRRLLYFVSLALLIVGVIYMVSIPLPTEFSFGSYF